MIRVKIPKIEIKIIRWVLSKLITEIKKITAKINRKPVNIPCQGLLPSGNNPTPIAQNAVNNNSELGNVLLYSLYKKYVVIKIHIPKINTVKLKIHATDLDPKVLT